MAALILRDINITLGDKAKMKNLSNEQKHLTACDGCTTPIKSIILVEKLAENRKKSIYS